MTEAIVILELPSNLYEKLQSLATEEQTEPIELIARLVALADQQHQPKSPTPAFRCILERATDLGIPDLAEQHDHYLYRVEKQ